MRPLAKLIWAQKMECTKSAHLAHHCLAYPVRKQHQHSNRCFDLANNKYEQHMHATNMYTEQVYTLYLKAFVLQHQTGWAAYLCHVTWIYDTVTCGTFGSPLAIHPYPCIIACVAKACTMSHVLNHVLWGQCAMCDRYCHCQHCILRWCKTCLSCVIKMASLQMNICTTMRFTAGAQKWQRLR